VGLFPLTFSSELQETTAIPGATNVAFEFRFTNTSPDQVSIQRVHTSCGCTTAQLPSMPWVIEAGGDGSFNVAMDIRGKRKQVSKMVFLYTDKGFKALTVRTLIPTDNSMSSTERLRNLQIAGADRQAVFRGDCARCHSEPANGKRGRALFQAVCAVCHEAEHRAEMVPDLRRLDPMPDEEGWRRWVTHGKAGTLMPAFAQAEGGPLTPQQVDSLVGLLVRGFPQHPPSANQPPTPPPSPAP
jgi:mono/diheme cytochrome c family protein